MARNWTEKERKKQAAIARRDHPWQKSTGPKTDPGKEAVKTNAIKHGLFTQEGQSLRRTIRAQKIPEDVFNSLMAEIKYDRQCQVDRLQKILEVVP